MILASFRTQGELMRAAARLRAEPAAVVETYTAEEPPGPDAPDSTVSPVPLVILVVGVLGAAGMFLLQLYAVTWGYRLDIGAKPGFSWPAFVPNAFEVGVLLAMLAGFAAFLVVNRLPRLYEPIDEVSAFRGGAMRDGNFLAVRRLDPDRARAVLAELRPELIDEVPE